jgi:hypothetical protein
MINHFLRLLFSFLYVCLCLGPSLFATEDALDSKPWTAHLSCLTEPFIFGLGLQGDEH